jgi:demethylspheroidene O-methyltransferase
MAAISPSDEPRPKFWDKWRARYLDLVGSAAFQSWAAHSLFTRATAKRDGEWLFDLVAGFTYSQILQAFVALDLQRHLRARPAYPSELAAKIDAPERRISVLCQAAASLGLLTRLRDGRYALARLGAAINGVGGLRDMILHHDILYRDLGPAEGFFRGETDPDLARFWPYVFGAAAAEDPATAERYSHLMSETQNLVSDEILSSLSFGKAQHVMDIGGGTGVFLAACAKAHPDVQVTLFDLPQVAALAQDRFERAGIAARATIVSGSFRDDPLPIGPDLITLIRVLYWRGRSEDKKQGSSGEWYDEDMDLLLESCHKVCLHDYKELLENGVCPEQARMVLPQSTMTEWYWSGSLDAFADMCNLRCKGDTQAETQYVAWDINYEMNKLFPVSWKALRENG